MMDGILYDPQEEGALPVPELPMMDNVQKQPTMWDSVQQGIGNVGAQIGNGLGQVRNFAQQNPDLLLAAAAGIGKGTPMGNMAESIQSHYQLQDQLKQKKDAQAAMLSLQRDKLNEAQRLNNSKIDANTAKALKDGTAKVTNVGNGVLAITKPGDAAPTYVTNEDYQNFQREITDTKGQYYMLGQGAKMDATPESPAMTKLKGEAQSKAQQASTTLDRWQRAKSLLEAQGAPELAGLPFVSRVAQILGSDTASAYQVLSQLKVDEGFTNIPHGQGSMSNIEREMLMAPIPSMDASTDVWLNYINRRLPIIEQAAQKHQAYADGLEQPKKGMATMRDAVKEIQQGRPQKGATAPQNASTAPSGAPVDTPGFKNGVATSNDGRIDILKQELSDESKQPDSPRKQSNLDAIHRQLAALGYKVPAAAAPAPAAAAGGLATYNSVADVQAAIKAGKLKSGDFFLDPKGNKRKVN